MWIVLALVVIVILAVVVLPQFPPFKGYRTIFLGWATTVIGAVVPLATEIVGYLQGLDWRQYILNSDDHRNLIVLAIVGGLGVLMVVMRHLTNGPVGTK